MVDVWVKCAQVPLHGAIYNGVRYDRKFNPESEEPHPHKSEIWIIEFLLALFSEDDAKMPIFFQTEPTPETATVIRLLGCAKFGKRQSTWKELVFFKERRLMHIYNLVSHGRRMYRTLAFSSDQAYALHGFAPNTAPRKRGLPPDLRLAVGSSKLLRGVDRTLVVTRKNDAVGGIETYVPPRLLQGLVPSALLEAFRFWEGADGILRGEPLDRSDLWFSYNVYVTLLEAGSGDWRASIMRRPQGAAQRRFRGEAAAARLADVGELSRGESTGHVVIVDDLLVAQLSSMGFGPAVARLALKRNNLDLTQAAAFLLDEANMEELIIHESKVDLMMQAGFSAAIAEHALEVFSGDRDVAMAWLSDPQNTDEVMRLEVAYSGGAEAASHAESAAMEVDTTTGEGQDMEDGDGADDMEPIAKDASLERVAEDLVLCNLMEAPKGCLLQRVATLLSRLEDLSHILVWARKPPPQDGAARDASAMETDDTVTIVLVELPRLKLSLQPRKTAAGLRLYLLDHSGWYVSDRFSPDPAASCQGGVCPIGQVPPTANGGQEESLLRVLMEGLNYSLVLENESGDVQILLANQDVHRPKIQGEPFSTQLVFDRASAGWQEAMETRYYLYPVHTSKTFLMPPTLSSTLYLILLRMLHRDHLPAFKLIESCSVDVPFTPEESWVWSQLERTLDDAHPDAHACRLKLSLAVQYSRASNKTKWENHVEMDRYLGKLGHVSAGCRLTYEEELNVLYISKQGTPIIKTRLEYLKAAKAGKLDLVLKTDGPRWGGQPWVKLNLQTLDYVTQNGTKMARVHYRKPQGPLRDADCLALIWDDTLLMDEESGSNRQMGFLMLYELARKQVAAVVAGQDAASDLASIFSRYFHLKLSRWGKEQVDEGEVECSNSAHMAHLAAVLAHPTFPWPVLPTDQRSTGQLQRGLNIFSPEGRTSNVKAWFDLMDLQFVTCMGSPAQDQRAGALRQVAAFVKAHPLGQQLPIHVHPDDAMKVRGERIDPLTAARQAGSIGLAEFPVPYDTSCERLVIRPTAQVSAPMLLTLGTKPLDALDLGRFIVYEESAERVQEHLPIDVSPHPAARTLVAQELLQRLDQDVQGYAARMNGAKVPRIRHLTRAELEAYKAAPSEEALRPLTSLLTTLVEDLQRLQDKDRAYAEAAISSSLSAVNLVPPSGGAGAGGDRPLVFWMSRYAGLRNQVELDYLTQCLMSSRAEADVLVVNPFAVGVPDVLNAVALLLMHINRISHCNRAMAAARELQGALQHLRDPGDQQARAVTVDRIHQASEALAEALTAGRYYVEPSGTGAGELAVDPRFLVFEYVFDLTLRSRQVEMVKWFVGNLQNGVSRVQQMIMGAGKTTVVGPLLTLILANGQQLVTQVMPTALLEQTRSILRNRFSAIIMKRVYTLEFDRSVEDDVELVGEIFAKLDGARRRRSVICASPEAIKSLLLKFVENLHAIEEMDPQDMEYGDSARQNREIGKMRESFLAKSDMADVLVRVMDMWHDGVLIMDEVDQLLHPLRSELNFPIGAKDPIDLAGYRWDLPIFLIDGVFYSRSGRLSERIEPGACARAGFEATEVLRALADAIAEGYATHALQRNPHLVLLDHQFYERRILPVVARWMLIWLHDHFSGRVGVGNEVLLAYLGGDIETHRPAVEAGLTAESKKLLNLARDWVCTLLPHCLSKVDRVSYGILNSVDLAGLSPRAPLSRRLMAVPFVGKDVPSASSEFAHVDVVIGLTVMAYRYEGVRLSDLRRLITQVGR
jgi:hypothetical protein